jgi:hypothetical protein
MHMVVFGPHAGWPQSLAAIGLILALAAVLWALLQRRGQRAAA